MTKETNETQNGRTPDLIGYTVYDRGEGKSAIWTQIGAAWEHKDGKGYDLRLQALPVDGRLSLRFKDSTNGDQPTEPSQDAPAPDQY